MNVRLLAATNADLERLVAAGRFRQDLYYRLSTINIQIPPLRERREEIPFLVDHFLARHATLTGVPVTVSRAALDALKSYRWPGNVRELRNAIERARVLVEGNLINTGDLPLELQCNDVDPHAMPGGAGPLPLAEMEARHIARVLKDTGGRRAQAAKILGISERNLYRKIKEYGIGQKDERDE